MKINSKAHVNARGLTPFTGLDWSPGPAGTVYLLEESTDLLGWSELATGLTAPPYALGTPADDRHFFRLRAALPASP